MNNIGKPGADLVVTSQLTGSKESARSADFDDDDCNICWNKLETNAESCPEGHLFCRDCFRSYANSNYTAALSTYESCIAEGDLTRSEVEGLLQNRVMYCPMQPCRAHPISAYKTVGVQSLESDQKPSKQMEVQSVQSSHSVSSYNSATPTKDFCCVIS